jgi:hypothetical protein
LLRPEPLLGGRVPVGLRSSGIGGGCCDGVLDGDRGRLRRRERGLSDLGWWSLLLLMLLVVLQSWRLSNLVTSEGEGRSDAPELAAAGR